MPDRAMPTRAISAFALLLPLFYLHVVVRMVIGPLLPAIEQELSITHAAAAGLLLLGTMGFSGLMLASSLMTSRITHRTTLAIATVLNAIGTLLVAVAPSLPVLHQLTARAIVPLLIARRRRAPATSGSASVGGTEDDIRDTDVLI